MSLDANHLITTGGECEFNFPGNEDWAYSSGDGGDFYGDRELPNIDYGHLPPVSRLVEQNLRLGHPIDDRLRHRTEDRRQACRAG